jgi:hypothetical protein
MELENAAQRVDQVGVELIDVARRLTSVTPLPVAVGAGAAGSFGELGRAMAGQAQDAIGARAAEAAALGAAASELAITVLGATSGYRDTDDRHGRSVRSGGA